MKISNISLGFSNKKYSHNLSRDCNTTFPFGVVQPIFTQYMLPDSDIKVSAKQLVRLSPLSVPSFARIYLRTVTRFVPEHDVIRWSDAFYAKVPYKGSIRTKMPYIDNPTLVFFMLSYSHFTVYHSVISGANTYTAYNLLSDVPSSVIDTFLSYFIKGNKIADSQKTLLNKYLNWNYCSPNALNSSDPIPNFENADYVVQVAGGYYFCFNFGAFAKNFRNICIGLGYSLDLDDFTLVRLSPLLSFYKAYYDTYGLTRFKSFTETKCFKFIEFLDDSYTDFTLTFGGVPHITYPYIFDFLKELATCYYSSPQDFVSIHRQNLQNTNQNISLSYRDSSGGSSAAKSSYYDDPTLIRTDSSAFTSVGLRTLQTLSRFVSKNSILGRKLSDYMRLHFGATSVESLFQDSNFIDSSSLACQINDVFSTSDTAQYNSNGEAIGEHLGAMAGKGIGFGDLSFNFHSPCHGYVITLASIVPESGYFQGNNLDLFAIDWEQQPCADFDALGMEVTPRSAFVSHNDIASDASDKSSDLTGKSFGFVPRYSGFKFAKNTVNGDMSRRGTIDSLSPYYLDHILSCHQFEMFKNSDKTQYTAVLRSAVIPSSSYDWRYVCKYPWLGNFLRIFTNDVGDLYKGTGFPSTRTSYDFVCIDDPFMCQIAFNCTVRNCLKPLSLSYDTFEESTDNATTDVDPS